MDQQQPKLNPKIIEMKKKKINLKETFQELEEILHKLESSNIDIDEMVKLYEHGMKLTEECKNKIEDAEQKIKIINQDDNESIEESDL